MNNYVIEAGISQAVFTLLYFLFLRNETHYASRRLFLTGSVLVGLIVPLLHLPLASSTFSAANGGVMPMYFLEAIMVSSGGYFMAPVAFLPISVFDLVYVFISSVFFLWFMVSLFHLYRMYRRSAPLLVQNVRVRVYPGLRQSFSFFGLIFIGDPHPSIIYHEQAHGKLGHSFDSVLVNLFRVICWWSPFVWLTINELKLVHEYQADAMVMKGDKARDYRRLLISASMVPFGMGLASSFHEGPLIKRLNAMKKQTKHIPKWKLVVLGMMVAIVTLFFSCSVEMEKEINNLTNESSLTWEYPVDVAESLSLLEAKYPDNKFTVVKVRTQTQEQRQEIAANYNIDMVESIHVDKKAGWMYLIFDSTSGSIERVSRPEPAVTEDNAEVFSVVDEQPVFKGGINALYAFVGENLMYPEQARKLGVEGQVFIEFIVQSDGSVRDVHVLKGIGAGCDAEAVRVLKQMPDFEPGKMAGQPVNVRMVLPIIFKLEK